MTSEHKDALHAAVHAHHHARKRIAEEAVKLAEEMEQARQQQLAVHAENDTAGKEKTSNA